MNCRFGRNFYHLGSGHGAQSIASACGLNYTAMPLEIHVEDQYALVPSDLRLCDLEAALPANLHYRAPLLGLTVGDWVRSGGFGQLNAPAVRHDVLGLEYRSDDAQSGQGSLVRAGGVVVKNVSGYDLVRFIVASDPGLKRETQLETLILRLRPKPEVRRREVRIEASQVTATLEEIRLLGAAFGFVYTTRGTWWARAEWWNAQPDWGEPTLEPVIGLTDLEIRDVLGVFPRPVQPVSALERRLLAAL
jgi:FAD/FMN-containing dehydrogenase